MRSLELLAPAADKEVAIQAILHGADAVYIGGPGHGARSKAANSVADIAEVVAFAHRYGAKVYVTVNTLVYENEIGEVRAMVRDLYEVGVDALIVQDMSLLRMDIPPVALHASTQCDTRTVEKARFLEAVGFSQIVLARELTLEEIRAVCSAVTVPVEVFVHGALCVSYSGRCSASQACVGRSANRGECAQMCRMPYTLRNGRGEVLERDKYLLSLRDFNTLDDIGALAEAGVSSFKIEGRMKDAEYVKNVTAAYRRKIDEVIASHPDLYRRSSYGRSEITFTPRLDKSFNRGFTSYFVNGRRPMASMAQLATPKSLGEEITDLRDLHPGDGIGFFTADGIYTGVGVNSVKGGRIQTARPVRIPAGAVIHRTFDAEWRKMMARPTAVRTIRVDVELDCSGLTARDERGCSVRIPLESTVEEAKSPQDLRRYLGKLGGTPYRLGELVSRLGGGKFIPPSALTALRRRMTEALDRANEARWRYDMRRPEQKEFPYISESLTPRDNVANSLARRFYRDHGVKSIEPAYEVSNPGGEAEVMTTRYCLRRELGVCLKDRNVPEARRRRFAPPLTIATGPHEFELRFDCSNCEMKVIDNAKK